MVELDLLVNSIALFLTLSPEFLWKISLFPWPLAVWGEFCLLNVATEKCIY